MVSVYNGCITLVLGLAGGYRFSGGGIGLQRFVHPNQWGDPFFKIHDNAKKKSHIYIYIYIMYTYIYIYIYVYSVCVYIYIYTRVCPCASAHCEEMWIQSKIATIVSGFYARLLSNFYHYLAPYIGRAGPT